MNTSEGATSLPAGAAEPASPGRRRSIPLGGSEAHAVASVGEPVPWRYPRWIAHRGAGKLAPENTLAAFELGARHGYRMFECDVKLSADDVPFLLHDDTLERTTNGQGVAGEQPWHALAKLDASSWDSPSFAGEGLPLLDSIARFCLYHGYCLNIEIKPSPGHETRTGRIVANEAARLWSTATGPVAPPLLTSFSRAALQAARSAQPQLPRGLLLDALPDGWLESAEALQCVAIICQHRLWTAQTVAQARQAGFRLLSYTVNDEASVSRLMALGTDSIITDRVDSFKPD
jgi:glycerophosphoryl diester phosphodiesterase